MARHRLGTAPLVAAFLVGFGLIGTAFQQRHPGFGRYWGSKYRPPHADTTTRRRFPVQRPPVIHPQQARAMLLHWNQIAIDASGLDHTVPLLEDDTVYGEQLGPTRAARAMAIVHIAMYDVINAIAGGYREYSPMPHAPFGTSMEAAIAQAAHDTLAALFTVQQESFDEELADDLAGIPNGPGKFHGIWLGRLSAALILQNRRFDGSAHEEPELGVSFFPSLAPGKWRQDPISEIPIALGARWGRVRPFVISSGARFRVPPPPDLDSEEYAEAYNEVKRLGGDGVVTLTDRTEDQTFAGIYWAYDGTPSLCAPPRLYNQITVTIADQQETNVVGLARLLALVNVAMADASIAIWESKYYYQFWRPITAIREADPGTGPTGVGDGNPDTMGDISFTPLGAPASNMSGPDFTPPFPAYPSGHAGFGGALFQVLRRFYGTDQVAFTFVSDELNGVTKDSMGVTRPLKPRSFESLSQAEDENGQSRIYLGIHFAFDKNDGIAQGRRVGDYVFRNAFVRRY